MQNAMGKQKGESMLVRGCFYRLAWTIHYLLCVKFTKLVVQNKYLVSHTVSEAQEPGVS